MASNEIAAGSITDHFAGGAGSATLRRGQGYGPAEINLGTVLTSTAELSALFYGSSGGWDGRYGSIVSATTTDSATVADSASAIAIVWMSAFALARISSPIGVSSADSGRISCHSATAVPLPPLLSVPLRRLHDLDDGRVSNDRVCAAGRRSVMNEVIAREIFMQEAQKRGLDASDDFKAQMELARQTILIRELGPVLVGLMVAGRVGSGIAAELGSMMVTDQIAALRALGTDPIRKLVLPRIVAGLVMVPLLTATAWSAKRSW